MSLKERISSPLEAGPSILDVHQLPPRLITALEHASSRLARKGMHATLVVVRRDYQMSHQYQQQGAPTALPTPTSPEICQTPISAASSASGGRHRLASTLKQLVRSGSLHDVKSATGFRKHSGSVRSNMSSPVFVPTAEPMSPRLRWPLTPTTPICVPPMTPSTTTTSTTTDGMNADPLDGFGMRLIHDDDLAPRIHKALQLTLLKTQKLYHLGQEWLSPAIRPAACGLTKHLIRQSILQDDVVFCSEGLTIVSLDRLYSLKSALSSYSRTKCALRLEDAVDELRRLVLARNGDKVPKADLLRSFDWLSVSSSALQDLDQMYRRAYGGPNKTSGIEGMPEAMSGKIGASAILPGLRIRNSEYETDEEAEWEEAEVMEIGMALTSTTPAEDPPKLQASDPKPPLLKLQTNFLVKPKVIRVEPASAGGVQRGSAHHSAEEDDDEDGDRTARPAEEFPIIFHPWGGSIDQVLSAEALSPQRSSMRMGPTTPNGYDDISPITRGEWGFLMVDDKFQTAKTVRVETC